MTTQSILDEKGHEVVSVTSSSSCMDAIWLFEEKGIGAVVVCERDEVVGMFTERDVVRVLAESGVDALKHSVKKYMPSRLITVTPATTVDEAMALMTKSRCRHLPVLQNGKLCGLISIGDVVKKRISDATREAEALKDYIATG